MPRCDVSGTAVPSCAPSPPREAPRASAEDLDVMRNHHQRGRPNLISPQVPMGEGSGFYNYPAVRDVERAKWCEKEQD